MQKRRQAAGGEVGMDIPCLWRGDGHRRPQKLRELLRLRPRRTIHPSLTKVAPLDHRLGINTQSPSFLSPIQGLVMASATRCSRLNVVYTTRGLQSRQRSVQGRVIPYFGLQGMRFAARACLAQEAIVLHLLERLNNQLRLENDKCRQSMIFWEWSMRYVSSSQLSRLNRYTGIGPREHVIAASYVGSKPRTAS